MREAIKRLEELVTLVEEKEATLTQELGKLQARKAEMEEAERKLSAKAANLSARERVVGKMENLSTRAKELDEKENSIKADKAKLKERLEANIKKGVELQKSIDENNKWKELYQKKHAKLEEEKQEMAKKEKMKDEIFKAIKEKF